MGLFMTFHNRQYAGGCHILDYDSSPAIDHADLAGRFEI